MTDVTQSHEQVLLMEGGLESVKATAAQLKAAGIAHDIEMTGGAPGSGKCCYVLAVAGQDLKRAEQVLSDIKSDRARALHQAQLAEKAKEKAKKLAKKKGA